MKGIKGPILLAALVALALVVAGVISFVRAQRERDELAGVPGHLVPATWSQYRSSPGHKGHIGKKDVACKDCHAFEQEGFKNPGTAPCATCHTFQVKRDHGGGNAEHAQECLTCHAFAPDKAKPTCISCHEKPAEKHAAIGVHATTKCTECHTPHGEKTAAETSKPCTACHDERSTRHAEHKDSKACTDCHAPHTAASQAKSTCRTCHATPVGPKPAGHDACTTCHKPHDFVGNVDIAPPSTSVPEAPRIPEGGQAPPAAQGVRASPCASCHAPKPILAQARAPTHNVCTNCHTPHSPKASAPGSCATCHEQVHVGHAKGPNACVACHQPHPNDPNRLAVSCTSCHAKVATRDNGAHASGAKTSCMSCHAKHDFKAPAAADKPGFCATCHAGEAQKTKSSKGHKACAQCHGDDTHKPQAAPTCATCHKTEAATAPQGHAACSNCHESHAGSLPAANACNTCHKNEAASKHGGVAGGCATCHRPHGPNGPASPPGCTTCHERPKLPALHAVNDHATCSNCHASHGPPRADRATCTSNGCHTDRANHQPQAQLCNGCHVFRK